MADADVHWTPEAAMLLAQPGQRVVTRDVVRRFGSFESALSFVMEILPVGVRGTARIQTGNATIQFEDLEAIYKGLKNTPSHEQK
jgi:hypothetical protein